MAKTTAALLPRTDDRLSQFGDRLRLARLRRRLSAKQVAERAGMAPMTLRSLERGGAGVTIGAYLAVMQVLGLDEDLDLLAQADPMGRELQDARLNARTGMTRPGLSLSSEPAATAEVSMPVAAAAAQPRKRVRNLRQDARDAPDWIENSGFTSADALAGLIEPLALPSKKAR